MNATKIALISLAVVILLLVTAGAVLSLPGVQRALLTRLVTTEPGESLDVAHFSVGWNRTEIRDLRFIRPGSDYHVAELTADLSLFDLIFRRKVNLGEVVATGLAIEIYRLETEGNSEPFEGILRQMELPLEVHLERLRMDGYVLLSGPTGDPLRGDFLVTGEGFAPGRESTIHWIGDLQLGGETSFGTLEVEGDLAVVQTQDGHMDQIRLLAQVSTVSRNSRPEEMLTADMLLLATAEGESYQAHFQRVTGNAVEEQEPFTLMRLDAMYRHGEGMLEGSWEIDVDHEQFAAFVARTELPPFSATGSGQFSYGITNDVFDLDGSLDLVVTDLGRTSDALAELGGFTLHSRFDLGMDEDTIRLEQIVLEVGDQDGRNLLEARSFQPIRYDRQTERLHPGDEPFDLAEVTIHALPLEWANLVFQTWDDQPEFLFQGGILTGQLLVRSNEGGLGFALTQPLRGDDIAVIAGDEPLLAGITFEATGSGSFVNGQLQGTLESLRLLFQGIEFLTATGRYDPSASQARAYLESNLGLLLAQPVLADFRNLEEGLLYLEFALDFSQRIEVQVDGAVRDLVSRDEQVVMPDVSIQAHLRQTDVDLWEIDAPMRIEGEQSSDIHLTGHLNFGDAVNRFELQVSGRRFALDHVAALGSAITFPDDGERPPPNDRDDIPFWNGWEGVVSIDVDQVLLQENYGLEDLRGDLRIEAGSMVNSLRAVFLDSAVEMDLLLRFMAEEDRPYTLNGSLEAPQLAADELFRQLQPERPPTLEGLFAMSVDIQGDGRTLPDLLDRVRGEARLKSSGGVIRLFYTENPVAGLGLAAGVVLGAIRDEVRTISQVASRLSHMPYEEMDVLVERDEELNFVLQELTVLSPELHLRGAGEIQHRDGTDILEQPMEIRLRLGANGDLGNSLAAIRALSEEKDELGYRQLRRDFTITGTPANPDASAFYQILSDTVLGLVLPKSADDEEDKDAPEGPEKGRDAIQDIFDIFRGL